MIVIPAYGRKYLNINDARDHWNMNKDFQLPDGGPYLNKTDARNHLPEGTVPQIYIGSKLYPLCPPLTKE